MKVLFLCSANIFRSQMAEVFFNKYSKKNVAESAALIKPQEKMNALVVRAMKEEGLDISKNISKKVTQNMLDHADILILMNPSLKEYLKENKPIEVWEIPDIVAKETDEHLYPEFVKARDIIESKVKKLVKRLEITS